MGTKNFEKLKEYIIYIVQNTNIQLLHLFYLNPV